MKHFSEADLLETYYMQPGESMPVMMHLAACSECAARYERLERKLREAAACHTEKPDTFWTRQRLQIMRRIDAQQRACASARRTLRVAAAAILAFFLGGAVVYETRQARRISRRRSSTAAPVAAQPAPAPSAADIHDAWQSEELKDFHNVVEWESWVPDSKTTPRGSSLMKRIASCALLTAAFATSAFAQNLPPGKWWRRPEIVQILNLAEEQQDKLETIFRSVVE